MGADLEACLGNGAAGCGDVRGGGTDVDKADTLGFSAPWMGAGQDLLLPVLLLVWGTSELAAASGVS